MNYPINNYPINWVDGMKISKDHFTDSDKHFTDLVRDSISGLINENNFGLLPPSPGSKDFFELVVSENNSNTLNITLLYCSAITAGGFKIFADNRQKLNQSLTRQIKGSNQGEGNNEVSWYDIVISSNPYNRVPNGTPSVEESPPRHPYTEVKYELEIVPSEKINAYNLGPYHLLIGKIKNQGSNLSIVENYIPACASISAHPKLVNFLSEAVSILENIQKNAFNIIRKLQEKNKPSPVAKNFALLCHELLNYLASISYSLKNELRNDVPVRALSVLSSLSDKIYTTLQFIHPEEKEELLKYIYEWTGHSPGEMEALLLEPGLVSYNHFDIEPSINAVNACLKNLEIIWKRMSHLEFVGQRKENIVVIKETIQSQPEPTKKRWSILD